MFFNCHNLTYIDISSFGQSNDTNNDDFFHELPSNGTIKINSNFLQKIKQYIPDSWEIIINDR